MLSSKTPDRVLLTVGQAAAYTSLSEAYLNKLRTSGGGPLFIKLGKRRVAYRRVDIDDWIDKGVRRSTSDDGGAA